MNTETKEGSEDGCLGAEASGTGFTENVAEEVLDSDDPGSLLLSPSNSCLGAEASGTGLPENVAEEVLDSDDPGRLLLSPSSSEPVSGMDDTLTSSYPQKGNPEATAEEEDISQSSKYLSSSAETPNSADASKTDEKEAVASPGTPSSSQCRLVGKKRKHVDDEHDLIEREATTPGKKVKGSDSEDNLDIEQNSEHSTAAVEDLQVSDSDDSQWTDVSDKFSDDESEDETKMIESTPVKAGEGGSLSEEEKQNFAFISEQLSILNDESHQINTPMHKRQKKISKTETPSKHNKGISKKGSKMSASEVEQRKSIKKRLETTPPSTPKKVCTDFGDSCDDGDASQGALQIDVTDLDENLEQTATSKGLTAANVKTIIHELVKNPDVQQMIKNTISAEISSGTFALYEPKMTRSKIKEVIQKGEPLQTWPLSPVKKTSAAKKPSILEIEFPDDEEDDEYCPEKDAEAQHESDDDGESVLSSRASDLGSPFPTTPSTPKNVTSIQARTPQTGDSMTFRSPMSIVSGVSVHHTSALGQHFKRSMAALDEESAQSATSVSDTIARRTRSKLPLTDTSLTAIEEAFVAPDITPDMYDTECDDSEWQEFLRSLIKFDPEPEQHADDEVNDPEFNFLEEAEKVEETPEDFRFDKPFRVSKKELNLLMNEIHDLFPDPEEEEDKSVEVEESQQEETTPEKQPEQPTEEISFSTNPNRRELEEHCLVTSPEEKLLIEEQMRKHVQLTTQLFYLCKGSEEYEVHTSTCRQLLRELDIFRCVSVAADLSSYNVCNLQSANDLVTNDEPWNLSQECETASAYSVDDSGGDVVLEIGPDSPKRPKKKGNPHTSHPLLPSQIDVFWNSPVFLYPDLLPRQRLLSMEEAAGCRVMFTRGEDNLIALGLEQFHKLKNNRTFIQKYLMPAKTVKQINMRIKNLCAKRSPDNLVKIFKQKKKLPTRALIVPSFSPSQMKAPKDQDDSVLPSWARKKRQKEKALLRKKKKKKKRSSSMSSLLEIDEFRENIELKRLCNSIPAKPRSLPSSPNDTDSGQRRSVEDSYSQLPQSLPQIPLQQTILTPQGVLIPFKVLAAVGDGGVVSPAHGISSSPPGPNLLAVAVAQNLTTLSGSVRLRLGEESQVFSTKLQLRSKPVRRSLAMSTEPAESCPDPECNEDSDEIVPRTRLPSARVPPNTESRAPVAVVTPTVQNTVLEETTPFETGSDQATVESSVQGSSDSYQNTSATPADSTNVDQTEHHSVDTAVQGVSMQTHQERLGANVMIQVPQDVSTEVNQQLTEESVQTPSLPRDESVETLQEQVGCYAQSLPVQQLSQECTQTQVEADRYTNQSHEPDPERPFDQPSRSDQAIPESCEWTLEEDGGSREQTVQNPEGSSQESVSDEEVSNNHDRISEETPLAPSQERTQSDPEEVVTEMTGESSKPLHQESSRSSSEKEQVTSDCDVDASCPDDSEHNSMSNLEQSASESYESDSDLTSADDIRGTNSAVSSAAAVKDGSSGGGVSQTLLEVSTALKLIRQGQNIDISATGMTDTTPTSSTALTESIPNRPLSEHTVSDGDQHENMTVDQSHPSDQDQVLESRSKTLISEPPVAVFSKKSTHRHTSPPAATPQGDHVCVYPGTPPKTGPVSGAGDTGVNNTCGQETESPEANPKHAARTPLEIIASLCPYYFARSNQQSVSPRLKQSMLERTPPKRHTPALQEIRPKPVFCLNDGSLPKTVSPFLPKQTSKSPKRVGFGNRTILPKTFVHDPKESPTKRAARSLTKRAHMIVQRTSPCKLLPQSDLQRIQRLQMCQLNRPILRQKPMRKGRTSTRRKRTSESKDLLESEESGKRSESSPSARGLKRKLSEGDGKLEESDGGQSEVEEASLSQEESQNEDDTEDAQSHLDMLMAASTTLGFGQKKSSAPERIKGKPQKRTEQTQAMLAANLLESDPKKDEKDTAFAQAYLDRVREVLRETPDMFEEFLRLMYNTGKDEMMPLQLYEKLSDLLADFPDLLEDFACFLFPEQAVVCGCFMKNQEAVRARMFLRKLEVNYESQPHHFQKVLKVLSQWYQNPSRKSEDLKNQMKPLLRGMTHLQEEFSLLFAEEKPPDSYLDSFESVSLSDSDLEDDTSVDSFEEEELLDDSDPYRSKHCPCDCHKDPSDIKFHKRLKHCINCCLKVIDGRLYFQLSRMKLVPAKVVMHKNVFPPGNTDPVDIEDEQTADKENLNCLGGRPLIISPSVSHTSPPKAKRIKLKIKMQKNSQKRFVALNEIEVSPVKREAAGDDDEVLAVRLEEDAGDTAMPVLSLSPNCSTQSADDLIMNPPVTLQADILQPELAELRAARVRDPVQQGSLSAAYNVTTASAVPAVQTLISVPTARSPPPGASKGVLPSSGFLKLTPTKSPASPGMPNISVGRLSVVPENSTALTVADLKGMSITVCGPVTGTSGALVSNLSSITQSTYGPNNPILHLQTPSSDIMCSTVSSSNADRFPNLMAADSVSQDNVITLQSGQQSSSQSTPSAGIIRPETHSEGTVPPASDNQNIQSIGLAFLDILDSSSFKGEASQASMSDILAKAMKTAHIGQSDGEVSVSVDMMNNFLASLKQPGSANTSPFKNPAPMTQSGQVPKFSLQEQLIQAGIITKPAVGDSDQKSAKSNQSGFIPIECARTGPPEASESNVQEPPFSSGAVTVTSQAPPPPVDIQRPSSRVDEVSSLQETKPSSAFQVVIPTPEDVLHHAEKPEESAEVQTTEAYPRLEEEPEVEWTKDMDKVCLEMIQRCGEGEDTFVKIAEKLKIVTPSEVSGRFEKLMSLLSCGDDDEDSEENSDEETDTGS